jgi:catechol 2,3-dioxygenase-like lactoylglutathione lyase family enzyme
MKSFIFFVAGAVVGTVALHTATAQSPRTSGLNHVGIVTANYAESMKYYTESMGFREAYTMKNADGTPLLTYIQLNRDTFIELIPARAGQATGITHFGIEAGGSLEQLIARLREHGQTVPAPGLTPAKANSSRVRDPNNVEIEVMEFGPESSQRKAIDSWKP